MQKADHSGHRSRMREKYLKSGIDIFAPHEILELMLYYAIPYKNTNDIAKALIDRFGSLTCVFDAPIDSLTDAGLTENQAILGLLRFYQRGQFRRNAAVHPQDRPHRAQLRRRDCISGA